MLNIIGNKQKESGITINRGRSFPTLMTDLMSMLDPEFGKYLIPVVSALRATLPKARIGVAVPWATEAGLVRAVEPVGDLYFYRTDFQFMSVASKFNTFVTGSLPVLKLLVTLWDRQIYVPAYFDSIDDVSWQLIAENRHKVIKLEPLEESD